MEDSTIIIQFWVMIYIKRQTTELKDDTEDRKNVWYSCRSWKLSANYDLWAMSGSATYVPWRLQQDSKLVCETSS